MFLEFIQHTAAFILFYL